MPARERGGDRNPLPHSGRTVADPAVEQRGEAQCGLQRAQTRADGVKIAPDQLEHIARPQRLRQRVGRRRKAEALRPPGPICGQVFALDQTRSGGER
ncbi:hypothetical protein D9M73_135320 [compost metagenome]